jgi:hypothetical protein
MNIAFVAFIGETEIDYLVLIIKILGLMAFVFLLFKVINKKPETSLKSPESVKHAHERLILFLERIRSESLFGRLSLDLTEGLEVQQASISAINEEFNHNLTQQLYVSNTAWQLIKQAKDFCIADLIATPALVSAKEYKIKHLSNIERLGPNSIEKALDQLNSDFKKNF